VLADGNRNYDGEGNGRIGNDRRGPEANPMEASVKWFRDCLALVFGLAVPRCWKLALPTLDAF
jgi:hypothetical protein